jgi:hypothetical protein
MQAGLRERDMRLVILVLIRTICTHALHNLRSDSTSESNIGPAYHTSQMRSTGSRAVYMPIQRVRI